VILKQLTFVIVGGVVALVVAGSVDVLRRNGFSTSSSNATPTGDHAQAEQLPIPETKAAPLARCIAQQLALRIENLGVIWLLR
jgi:hypothetical protein